MRKTVCILVLVALFITGKAALAEDEKIVFDVTADYLCKYIWRGQNLNDDPVFQPGVSMTYGGLTAGVWGSWDTTGYNDKNSEFYEIDYSLDYSGDTGMEGLGYSIGVINYYFPGAEDTTELYCGFSYDCMLNPSVTVYHDVDEIDGTYISFGVEHGFGAIAELGPDMPVGADFGASLGWGSESYNSGYWGVSESKLNDLVLSMSFPVEMNGWTVAGVVNYITLTESAIKDSDRYDTDDDYVVAGISLSTRF